MSRVLIVAKSEFLTLVKTKAFIISIILMPVLMGAFFLFMSFAARNIDVETRPFAVIDGTGVLFEPLRAAATVRNAQAITDGERTGPEFVPSKVATDMRSSDDLKLELSEQVRTKKLFAFVEIPADVITATGGGVSSVRYYAENTTYEPLPRWLQAALNEEITKLRFDGAGIDQDLIARLNTRIPLSTFGLVERTTDGTVTEAVEVDELARALVPGFFLILMFMTVMTSAQHCSWANCSASWGWHSS
jgi:ABC-2 type transport system permease protein